MVKLAPVILPVVLMIFEPKLAIRLTTLAFEYVAGNPVNCEPLPKIYEPVILPAADTSPPVSKLPVVVLPVTLSVGNMPTLVAATPVNKLPLPR